MVQFGTSSRPISDQFGTSLGQDDCFRDPDLLSVVAFCVDKVKLLLLQLKVQVQV